MKKFNFDLDVTERRGNISARANSSFNEITSLSNEIRNDNKERLGMEMLVKEINTKNLILFSVLSPPEISRHFANEKSGRSAALNQVSSQNSENPDEFKFRGCITFTFNDGTQIQISVSGLQPDEDVAVAIDMMASIVETTTEKVIKNVIDHDGLLPDWVNDRNHYLYKFIS